MDVITRFQNVNKMSIMCLIMILCNGVPIYVWVLRTHSMILQRLPSFGIEIEFKHKLQTAFEDQKLRSQPCLARYSQIGMTAEDARQATPEHMQETYQRLIDAHLPDVYTPPPSPRHHQRPHQYCHLPLNHGRNTLLFTNDPRKLLKPTLSRLTP